MNLTRIPPAWRLPDGVDAPLWQYTHTPRLAADEDAYFEGHPLFQADEQTLDERFTVPAGWSIWAAGPAGTRSVSPAAGSRSPRSTCRGRCCTSSGMKAGEAGVDSAARSGESLPARMSSGPELRLRHLDVQHPGHDSRPRLAAPGTRRRPGGFFGRAGGSPSMCTISGSTCAIRRAGAGCWVTPRKCCHAAIRSAIAGWIIAESTACTCIFIVGAS